MHPAVIAIGCQVIGIVVTCVGREIGEQVGAEVFGHGRAAKQHNRSGRGGKGKRKRGRW